MKVDISFNESKNGIEIRFDQKPSEETISQLRSMRFTYSKFQKMWYAKKTLERIDFANELKRALETGEPPTLLDLRPSFEPTEENIDHKNFSYVSIVHLGDDNKSIFDNYVVFEPYRHAAEEITRRYGQQLYGDNFKDVYIYPKNYLRKARVLLKQGKVITFIKEPKAKNGKTEIKEILLTVERFRAAPEYDKGEVFHSWDAANRHVRSLIGKYSNVYYKLIWKDGEIREGVMDLEPRDFYEGKTDLLSGWVETFLTNVSKAKPGPLASQAGIDKAKRLVEHYSFYDQPKKAKGDKPESKSIPKNEYYQYFRKFIDQTRPRKVGESLTLAGYEEFSKWLDDTYPDTLERDREALKVEYKTWVGQAERTRKRLERMGKQPVKMQPYSAIYTKLNKLVPDLVENLEKGKTYGKSKLDSEALMDLNFDLLYKDEEGRYIIALSHYYKQAGDLIADPDMQIRIDPEMETAEALSYQDTYGYHEVYLKKDGKDFVNQQQKKEQNKFLSQWLTNALKQGHIITLAGSGENDQEEEPGTKENSYYDRIPTKVEILTRTFEAKSYPKGSKEREKLNEDSLTSEYMPSEKYEARVYLPANASYTSDIIKRSFRTKKDAQAYIEEYLKEFEFTQDEISVETREATTSIKELEGAITETEEGKQEGLLPGGRILLDKIIILWSEGSGKENVEFSSWREANDWLKSLGFPSGGYYKTKFKIIYRDGYEYEGRLDLARNDDDPTITDNVIGDHVYSFLLWEKLTEEGFSPYIDSKSSMERADIVEFFERYDLGLAGERKAELDAELKPKIPIDNILVSAVYKSTIETSKEWKREDYPYNVIWDKANAFVESFVTEPMIDFIKYELNWVNGFQLKGRIPKDSLEKEDYSLFSNYLQHTVEKDIVWDYQFHRIQPLLFVADAERLSTTTEDKGGETAVDEKNIEEGAIQTEQEKQIKKKIAGHELNQEIEQFIEQRDKEGAFYTAEDKVYINKYAGSGGFATKGVSGKGILYEYYTPGEVVKQMWGLAYRYGYQEGDVLEPSVGTGNFLKYSPVTARVVGYETNPTSKRIAEILYPHATIYEQPFESIFFKGNVHLKDSHNSALFDLVIGNPPYGEFSGKYAGMGEKKWTRATRYEEYFMIRGLDLLRSGGLLIFIIPSGFLEGAMSKAKEKIAERCEAVLDAYRLPGRIFSTTEIGTDIIVLKRK